LLIEIRALKYAGRDGRTISDQMQHGIINQMGDDLEEDQDVAADSHSVTCWVKIEVKRKRRKINICSKISTYAAKQPREVNTSYTKKLMFC
jgi:hypothetical protein